VVNIAGGSALTLPDEPSIAVLPFVNMSGDSEQEYFCDGITEDLIIALSKFSGLFVIARNSAFTYKGKAVKAQEVSKELGVRCVLEGSVRKAGRRVRVTAQLVDATTGYQLWAERYDRELQDIFVLQDEIVQQIVSNLIAEGRHAEQKRVRRIPTENFTAYDCLLRGIEERFRLTHEAMIQARQMFEKAIALDPQYAQAYVCLGWTYTMEWFWQWNQDPQTLEQAFTVAQKALALDGSLAEAHRLLGEVYLGKGQLEQANVEAEQAITLNPNDAYSYQMRAQVLNLTGKPQEALRLAEKAIRLDPRNREWYSYAVGLAYAMTGQYEEAIAAFKRVVTRYPNHVSAHMLLAALYGELGRAEEARAEAAEVLHLSPNFSVEGMRQRTVVKDPAVVEGFLAALHKAGLK
jgi:TolB-like protein/Flp pilus assembly protein TadD